jgi:hypothetical protein
MNESTHCIEQGRAALAAGRTAEAREWFRKAADLEPDNAEAQLQHALCALMAGDRRTFAGVYDAFRSRMENETSPRLARLWALAQRFSGTAAAVAATVALSGAACSNGTKEGTVAAKPDAPVVTTPADMEPETKDATPTGVAPMDDEVYSKHRYSAGVRPPVDVAPEPEMKADDPPPAPMDDEVYSKHRYSAGVRPPAPAPDAEEDEDGMQGEMKPTPMRPPALKYGAMPRYGGGLRSTDL